MSDYTQPPTLASDRKKYISEFGVKEYINTDSSTYQDINRLLRHGKAPLFLSSKSPDLHIKTILIKILMATSYVNQNRLENPKTLYRRMTVKNLDDLVNAYQPGSIISEPAFTSTGKQDEWNGNILYVIHADSESGSDLSHLNQECGGEILFRPGTRFKVLKMEPNSEASSTGRPSELTIFLTTFEKGDNHGSDTEV
ncbi:MAG: hypothetical protein WCG42_01120 [Parachlamydiaceae bacterium]